MKKGEQPQFSARWWKNSQPKGLKSAGDLESALKAYETTRAKVESSGEEADAKAADGALDGIDKAVKAVLSEASKTKGNPDIDATTDCLKKFDRGSAQERKWIQEHTKAKNQAKGDDDEDDSNFADPDAYKTYLITVMKRLRSSGEMNFGFVLGKKAEDHRMALHKSKSAKALGAMLAKETGIHLMTWGIARSSEDRAGEMVMELEGRQIPGMAKKGARMLKKFKPLPFKKLVLLVDGQEVADLDDPEDTDADEAAPDAATQTRVLSDLARRIQGVADPARKADLARMATQANALLRSNSLAEAEERIDELRSALDEAGVPANGGSGAAQENGSSPAAFTKARQAWSATRKRVEDEVEKLQAAIVTAYKDHEMVSDLEASFRTKVAGTVLQNFDERLSEKLNEVAAATDAVQRKKLIDEAKGIMEGYRSYVTSEPLLADLDDNPFEPLKIRQTVTTTLSALEQIMH
jgi:hypothetical protein